MRLLFLLFAVLLGLSTVSGQINYIETVVLNGSGNWTIPANVSQIGVLVVAGGGGSGAHSTLTNTAGGGGGAGGLIFIEGYVISSYNGTIPFVIGSGGAGAGDTNVKGQNGGNSTFGNLIAIGGGGGGSSANRPGVNGGSGGGGGLTGSNYGTGGATIQPATNDGYFSTGFGNAGASSDSGGAGGGGGSGGAGGVTAGGVGLDVWGVNYAKGGGATNTGTDARANRGDGGRSQGVTSSASGRPGTGGTIVIRYFYDFFTITLKDADTNATINDFNATINGVTYSTTNGLLFTNINSSNTTPINVIVSSQGYASFLYQNVVPNDVKNLQALAYQPTFVINVYNENNGTLLNQNVTAIFYTNTTSFTRTINNGTATYTNTTIIPDGDYEISFSSTGYTFRVYQANYNQDFLLTLNVYLLPDTSSTAVFTLEDRETRNSVSDAQVSIQRFINGTLTTISVVKSDITGRFPFTYADNIEYKFTALKTGYEIKQWTLNPVSFPAYTILMDSIGSVGYTGEQFSGVNFLVSTGEVVEGTTIPLNASVSSAEGNLVSYTVSVVFNGSTIATETNNNAFGSFITTNFTLPQTSFNDTIIVLYDYTTSQGNTYTFSRPVTIIQVSPFVNQSWSSNKDLAEQIPLLERVILVVIAVGSLSALAFTFLGVGAGVLSAMIIMALFSFIGFVNPWLFVVSFIGLSLVLLSSGGRT
jgi:hypothetical protein